MAIIASGARRSILTKFSFETVPAPPLHGSASERVIVERAGHSGRAKPISGWVSNQDAGDAKAIDPVGWALTATNPLCHVGDGCRPDNHTAVQCCDRGRLSDSRNRSGRVEAWSPHGCLGDT